MPTKGYKKITTHKRCTKCGELLPRNIDNFYKNTKNYDGLTTTCRKCTQEYRSNHVHRRSSKKREKDKALQYRKNRRKDPANILIDNLRNRVWRVLNRTDNKSEKYFKQNDVLGCSPLFLREHIESQFRDGMTWDNYGIGGWWIDHIKPCDSFKPFTKEQQKECFHYSNLQPLWWYDNIAKGNSCSKVR